MTTQPLRLAPGADLRRELEALASAAFPQGCFVVCGIGSLVSAQLRLAAREDASFMPGPIELLSLAGTVTADGAHLHACVADADGHVMGGHLVYGNEIRTTAEVLLAPVPGWELGRAADPATGFKELTIRPSPADAGAQADQG